MNRPLDLIGIVSVKFHSTSYTMAEKNDVSPESGMSKNGTAGKDAHDAVHTEDSTRRASSLLWTPATQSQMSLSIYLQPKVYVP